MKGKLGGGEGGVISKRNSSGVYQSIKASGYTGRHHGTIRSGELASSLEQRSDRVSSN